jgi:hypothetical protein
MPKLVIEYQLDGKRPGYAFASPAPAVDERTLKTIWRQAMPRGQGWGNPTYAGAQSVKTFRVDKGHFAVSTAIVTDQRDESGRGGIRRAEIEVMSTAAYLQFLQGRIGRYPGALQQAADRRLTHTFWQQVLDKLTPKLRPHRQIVLAYPYHDPDAWALMEVLVMKVATSRRIRLIKGWGAANSFTTLALDYREESSIVALPLARAREVGDGGMVVIR